jgi:MscS family membrane protein
MQPLIDLMNQQFLGISTGRYALALTVVILAVIGKKVFAFLLNRIALPFARKSKGGLDEQFLESVRRPAESVVLILGLFLAVQILRLPEEPYNIHAFAISTLKAIVIFVIAWLLFNLVGIVDHYLNQWAARTESALDDQLAPLVRKSLRIFIVVMAGLMAIQSFGYPITGLLASLGIGGLAFALAARDTISNIFGSLMIIFDRPFHVGDWIKAGDMEGTVEEIGFRSTKIRTFAKTLIMVPNNVIANMPIDNFSRMPKRRIKLNVGVTYDTKPAQMREAVKRIREMLTRHPAVDQDFFLVNFTDFGASSLDIMVYCFTTTTIWGDYLDAREDVCLKIMDLLEGLGLEIAFPSQTLYLHQEDQAQAEARA